MIVGLVNTPIKQLNAKDIMTEAEAIFNNADAVLAMHAEAALV